MDVIRIMLVDDSVHYRAALASLLAQDARLTIVAQAGSAAQALALVEQQRPDLVLVDVVMPGMSGIELARRLKALANPPRVILLTMHTPPAYRAAALAAGADDFLTKDQVTSALAPALSRLFLSLSPASAPSHDGADSPRETGGPA